MKINPKSFLVNVWLRNVNPVQLRSSIKFLKEVYKEIKQIKYKNLGFDTCNKGMDMDIWNSKKWLANKFLNIEVRKCLKNNKKKRFKMWIKF